MTLFWHNHFVSSFEKVRSLKFLYDQNVKLRKNALGSFRGLLFDLAKDPAMLQYLDSVKNVKGHPNENFARELFELFTLGEGNYTEKDIQEAAKAFTGWKFRPQTGEFFVARRLHDNGAKLVFSKNVQSGEDVLNLVLKREQTAKYIVTKLWKEFVSPDVNASEVDRISKRFRDSKYDISVAMLEILSSNDFYREENRGNLIKSPIELLVGTIRQFDISMQNFRPLTLSSKMMGQTLFAPPNVKGWPGYTTWINSQTLVLRRDMLDRLFRNQEKNKKMIGKKPRMKMMAMKHSMDIDKWLSGQDWDGLERIDVVKKVLVALDPLSEVSTKKKPLSWIRDIVLDPVYQLK